MSRMAILLVIGIVLAGCTAPPERPSPELRQALDKRVKLDVIGLDDVVSCIKEQTGMNIILSQEASKISENELFLNIDGLAVKDALFWITFPSGLAYTIRENDVLIDVATALKDPAVPLHQEGEENTEWHKKLRAISKKKVSFDFLETPLWGAVCFLSSVSGIPIVIDPEVLLDEEGQRIPRNVTFRVENMPFEMALRWIGCLTGVDFTIARQAIFITNRKDIKSVWEKEAEVRQQNNQVCTAWYQEMRTLATKPVSFDSLETPLGCIVQFLARVTGLTIILEPDVLGYPHKATDIRTAETSDGEQMCLCPGGGER
ncbi:MAG: hypothetical protein ABIF71_12740 [Planctomycetota bacterium]